MALEAVKKEILERIKKYASLETAPAFIFGSSVNSLHFHDIDIGVLEGSEDDIAALRNEFEESTFPYKVDIVNFSTVSDAFRKKVFTDGILWLTQTKK